MSEIDDLFNQYQATTTDGPDVQLDPLDELFSTVEPVPEKSMMEKAQDFVQPYQDIYNKRMGEVAEAAKRYKRGEEGLGGMLYEALGSGVGGTIADVQGEIMSNFIPQSVEEAIAKMAQAGLETETGQYLIENYNNLSDSTKRKVDATFNLGALVPSIAAAKRGGAVVNKATRIKRNRLSELLSPLETPVTRGQEAVRRFKPDVRHEQMLDQLADLKGLSPNKSVRKNIEILDEAQSKLENKLMSQLRSRPVHIKSTEIENAFGKELKKLLTKEDWLQSDKAIMDNVQLQTEKLMRMIRRKGTTPEGLILARREFDSKLKKKMFAKGIDEKDIAASEAISRTLRKLSNKIAHDAALKQGLDVQGSLDKSSAIFRAVENLSTKYATETPKIAGMMDFAKRHPFATSGIASSLASNQLFGVPLDSPAILGAATVGPVAYGAYRYAPQTLRGLDATMRAGMLSAPAAMGYGAPDEEVMP